MRVENKNTVYSEHYVCATYRVWVTWLIRTLVIHSCDESQVRAKTHVMSRLKYSVLNRWLKEVKHEILEEMDYGELFQTAGAAWQNALSTNASLNLSVGDCSPAAQRWREEYETGSNQTDSAVLVMVAL